MSRGFTVLELIICAGLIVVLAAIAVPLYISHQVEAKEAEAKSGLHQIQLSVERYAADHDGAYPEYLIGGDLHNRPRTPGELNPNVQALTGITTIADRNGVSDPLIRCGYIDSYPGNPFATKGSVILDKQKRYGDPLRPYSEGVVAGCRFGGDGRTMGNVSCDYRFPDFKVVSLGKPPETRKSHADFDKYHFFDIWQGRKPRYFIAGEFFYKSNGPIVIGDPSKWDPNQPILPTDIDQYMMGVYGAANNKGKDVFGPEPFTYPNLVARKQKFGLLATKSTRYQFASKSKNETNANEKLGGCAMELPSWTRWVSVKVRGNCNPGSPFGEPPNIGLEQLSPVNPNGIHDAIILVLFSESK